MASAMWQKRKFTSVSDVISFLISIVDIKCDHLFSSSDQNRNEITAFFVSLQKASAVGRGGRATTASIIFII